MEIEKFSNLLVKSSDVTLDKILIYSKFVNV